MYFLVMQPRSSNPFSGPLSFTQHVSRQDLSEEDKLASYSEETNQNLFQTFNAAFAEVYDVVESRPKKRRKVADEPSENGMLSGGFLNTYDLQSSRA